MSCIYKIYLNEDVYVGSTTNYNARINKHKSNCNNPNSKKYNYFIYQFIRDNGGWDKFNKKIITETDKTGKELLELERYYIETLKSNLNSQIPTRSNKDYREDNKDKIKEQKKKYYETNIDKKKEKDKQYYEKNKDKIKEQKKEYCDNNREKINKKQNEKIICDICNSIVSRVNLLRHQRSNKCIACKLNINPTTT
jgi:hypothetical protein